MTPWFAFICAIEAARLDLSSEIAAQADIAAALDAAGLAYIREYALTKSDVIDFFSDGIGIEVKISGSARAIYRQVERYAENDAVTAIILATNRAMRLPPIISGKPTSVASLGRGWL